MPLPDAFQVRLAKIIPDIYLDSVLDSFSIDRRTGFRINPLVGRRDDILQSLLSLPVDPEPVDWYPDAFSIPETERSDLLDSELVRSGSV